MKKPAMPETGRKHAGVTSRRDFLATGALGALGASLPGQPALCAEKTPIPRGKAEHVIMLWLGGGASQIDTWDPKRRGDPKKKVAGSAYNSIPTAIDGAGVCEHLHRSAPLLDRAVLLRSVHHEVIDEHAAAVNRMHTGRPTSGTVVYPSMGSVVAHKLGKPAEAIPPYVLMGYPNLTRGPGFLGAKHGFIYLTDTEAGPAGLQRNPSISALRQGRREALLGRLRKSYLERRRGDTAVRDYSDAGVAGLRLAGPEFMGAFALDKEPASLRESYGSEFGQRCLLARRLVERGVRFIEVAHNLNFINGTGWDTHNEGQRNQHILIRELDKAFSTLVTDLEKRSMLEKTLILISTEFGRPPGFDGRGGRGHQSKTFSLVLAGGGLKSGQVVGQSDELGRKILTEPISIPDLFATVYNAVGIDPASDLYAGDRPVPLTDQGKPLGKLFA